MNGIDCQHRWSERSLVQVVAEIGADCSQKIAAAQSFCRRSHALR
jgi:hypothetical protein